jgi:hypothetical protein
MFNRIAYDQSAGTHRYCDGVLHIDVQEPQHRFSGFPLELAHASCDCPKNAAEAELIEADHVA